MVELPLPSVTRLPTAEPAAAAGAVPALNVMVWPSTVKLSPSATVAAPRALEVAEEAPLRIVVPEMRAGVVLLLLTALPVSAPIAPPSVVVSDAAVVPPAAPL